MTSWLSLLCLSVATALRAPTRTLRPRRICCRPHSSSSLAEQTVLSIDTGDLDIIEQYAKGGLISDATTNPLFVAQAGTSGDARYVAFVDKAIAYAKANSGGDDVVSLAMDRLAVELGPRNREARAGLRVDRGGHPRVLRHGRVRAAGATDHCDVRSRGRRQI